MPRSLALLAVAGLATSAASQPLTILDLAPANSAVLIGVDSVSDATAAFDRTELKANWWDQAGVQGWLKDTLAEPLEELQDELDELEIDTDELKPPTGMVGAAFWIPEELGEGDMPEPWEVLLAADFGEKIDGAMTMIETAIDRAEEKGRVWFEAEDFAGGTIWTVEEGENAEHDDEGAGDEWGENGGEPFDTEEQFLGRHGSHILFSTDLAQLEFAMERLAGEGGGGASAQSAEPVTSALEAAGGTGHGYFIANFRPLIEIVGLVDDGETGFDVGMGLKLLDVLRAVGVGDARSMAINLRFDGDEGMIESGFAAMLPEKPRLLALMDPPEASFVPPAYVTADASSVSLLQFDFANLFPVVNEIVGSLPPELVAEFRPQLGLAQGFAQPVLAQLGPKVYVIQRIRRPFSATSQRTLVAIECGDTQAFGRSLQQITQMIGVNLEQRTFQGSVVYDMAGPMFPGAAGGDSQVSIGLGAGAVMVGDTESVEGALRLGGQGGEGSLASENRFRDAMGNVPQAGLSFGYSKTREAFEYSRWTIENFDKMMDQQIEQMLGDSDMTPEQKEEFREQMRENGALGGNDFMENMPPLEGLAETLGDFVSTIRSTRDGYVGRSILLRPE